MGMLIDSPTLATALSVFVDKAFPDIAYRVTLGPDGELRWEDGATVYNTEPQTSWGSPSIRALSCCRTATPHQLRPARSGYRMKKKEASAHQKESPQKKPSNRPKHDAKHKRTDSCSPKS